MEGEIKEFLEKCGIEPVIYSKYSEELSAFCKEELRKIQDVDNRKIQINDIGEKYLNQYGHWPSEIEELMDKYEQLLEEITKYSENEDINKSLEKDEYLKKIREDEKAILENYKQEMEYSGDPDDYDYSSPIVDSILDSVYKEKEKIDKEIQEQVTKIEKGESTIESIEDPMIKKAVDLYIKIKGKQDNELKKEGLLPDYSIDGYSSLENFLKSKLGMDDYYIMDMLTIFNIEEDEVTLTNEDEIKTWIADLNEKALKSEHKINYYRLYEKYFNNPNPYIDEEVAKSILNAHLYSFLKTGNINLNLENFLKLSNNSKENIRDFSTDSESELDLLSIIVPEYDDYFSNYSDYGFKEHEIIKSLFIAGMATPEFANNEPSGVVKKLSSHSMEDISKTYAAVNRIMTTKYNGKIYTYSILLSCLRDITKVDPFDNKFIEMINEAAPLLLHAKIDDIDVEDVLDDVTEEELRTIPGISDLIDKYKKQINYNDDSDNVLSYNTEQSSENQFGDIK